MKAVVVENYDSIDNIRLKDVAMPEVPAGCVSAWNKDPVFGVIGIQSGPRH